jgi:serine/threonine protein kinase
MSEFFQKPQNFSKLASVQETVEQTGALADTASLPNLLASLGSDDQSENSFVPPAEKLIGRVIARKYEIIDLLGAGGMGFVYRAKHLELDKLMAIKILLLDKPLSDVAYARFKQEAQATGGLDHPNIVRVSDYGQIGEGCPYIVMELLQGQCLDDLITANGRLSVQDALPIFVQLADALAHAHSHGVIHRDLKPSNIMLIIDDKGERQAKIIDFGIAKLSGARAKAIPLTKPGEIFGSPLYMSPEQCKGNNLDQRSDIYSLGCAMYEMLVGKPPFVGDTVLATIYMHVNEPPAPINEIAANAVIPEELEKIIRQALHKEPDLRFQSAQELLEALQTFGRKYAKNLALKDGLPTLTFSIPGRQLATLFIFLVFLLTFAILVFPFSDKNEKVSSQAISSGSKPVSHKAALLKRIYKQQI